MHLTDYDIECIKKAKDFIDANFKRHHPIAEIAAYAGISQTRLKKEFKEIFNKGLYEYLHEGAMLKAVSLLENTDKTIKEISRTLGYKYPNNFCIAFKKRFGKTPGKWRIDNL
ncbi:MAG TPA: AraC family transcriptional regulator [Hanamia sp.]